MKVAIKAYDTLILFSILLSINSRLEEGNIVLPMTSNFTIMHKQNKINNKNYYTIPLKVGTPEEEFEVQVDTSTATSWLPSSKCTNCVLAHRLYDEEDSQTCSPTDIFLKIEDEDGNVEGYQTSDNIKLGSYKLKQYAFVQVTKIADNFRDHQQGKLGLGYKSHYLKDEEFNFLEKLKKNNLIAKKIFSINTINDKKGMLFIGDLPGKEYKSYCNVTDTDDLDDMYKESWVCQLSHVGVFEKGKGIFNKIKFYDELEHNKVVNFDSGYDFIAVPMAEKSHIEKLLNKAELECTEKKKESPAKSNGNGSLRNRIRDKEITITCKTSLNDLKKKDLALSFVLQGYSYSIPLESLFVEGAKDGEMEMLVKYVDDSDAIWTFGYPFMNQYLMIFNMEANHVGIKKLKKTPLPIISINNKDWQKYNLKENSSTFFSMFRTIGYVTLVVVSAAIVFFIYHAIRKRSVSEKGGINYNKDNVY